MHPQRFEGKSVIVTGGSTGIGRAVCIRFAREGANVVVDYYQGDEEAAETVRACRDAQREAGLDDIDAFEIQADVSSESDVERMYSTALDRFGRVDILINNAGIQIPKPSHEVETDAFDKVVDVNLRGAYLCSRAALRHFLSRDGGGVILNNSSVHEIIPKPEYVSYAISKGGMEQMTRTLALEYADRGIRVNGVGPGAIVTPINAPWVEDEEKKENVESHIPMGRVGRPEEIAAAFAFLASDEAAYVTGQTLFVCGGLTLFPEFRGKWSSQG